MVCGLPLRRRAAASHLPEGPMHWRLLKSQSGNTLRVERPSNRCIPGQSVPGNQREYRDDRLFQERAQRHGPAH